MNVRVTFEWRLPQATGPEVIVDYYRVIVSPSPLSHPSSNMVFSSQWNVTLDYNTEYTVTILTINAAGNSTPFSLANIEIGKLIPAKLTLLLLTLGHCFMHFEQLT